MSPDGEALGLAMLNTMAIVVVFMLVCMALNGVRVLIRNKWFLEKDFWGDKIKGKWRYRVEPGIRSLLHSFNNDRCNFCGQKNLALLGYKDHFVQRSVELATARPTQIIPRVIRIQSWC